MSCNHFIENNYCVNCGLYIESDINVSTFSRNQPKITSLKNSILDNLEIPEIVKKKAYENISIKQEDFGKKVRNDNKNTFIEIYNAYLQCGILDFNPKEITDMLNLSRKDINWCLKLASGTSLQEKEETYEESTNISIVIISPTSYLKSICKNNKIEEHYDEILNICKHILKKKDILYASRPEYVACAIIKKFCDSKNISLKCFGKKNNISDNALKKSIKEIDIFF